MQKNESNDEVPVLAITHWTKELFSFSLLRPRSFRFSAGEFVMLGLTTDEGQQILRAYSIASPTWSDALMFYSIIIKNVPLTSRLSRIKPFDGVALKRTSTGTLILNALKPAKRLFLFSTGTGFAPFASIIREPETYPKFDKINFNYSKNANKYQTLQDFSLFFKIDGDNLVLKDNKVIIDKNSGSGVVPYLPLPELKKPSGS
mgnify:CR=1 FL=1